MPTKKPLVSFVIPPELLDTVDDFRFDHRFRSRGAAIVWLLTWALKKRPKPPDQRVRRA